MELSDKAFNTLTVLRNATWLAHSTWPYSGKDAVVDADIEAVCKELVEYFKEWGVEAA